MVDVHREAAVAGRLGTYSRGTASAVVPAVPGSSVAVSGEHTQHEADDWLIWAEDLALDGQPILPARGDRYAVTIAGRTCTYEVCDLADKPCFERCDAGGLRLRVHSKLIKTEPA